MRRGAGRYPQPVALLARLGVDERHEGEGLGAALLLDVISRVASLSDAIGCRGLLVHAESEEARGFYENLIPEFERSPTDSLHLLLLLKDIRRTLGR
jgi:GNAT superfamily N-acetyltransferase